MRADSAFFAQPATTAAPALLGMRLCRRLPSGEVLRVPITETECYYGQEDTACHAHRGRTPRNSLLYRAGGCAYIYLCYGIHNLLNVVTGPEDHPEAVLLRGIEGYDGPGKLTKALSIDRALNGEDLLRSELLWLETGERPQRVQALPRVGIEYASREDRERLWRFRAEFTHRD